MGGIWAAERMKWMSLSDQCTTAQQLQHLKFCILFKWGYHPKVDIEEDDLAPLWMGIFKVVSSTCVSAATPRANDKYKYFMLAAKAKTKNCRILLKKLKYRGLKNPGCLTLYVS